MTAPAPASDDQRALRDRLVAARLLVDTGVAGIYGQAGAFLEVRLRVTELIRRRSAPDRAEQLAFPPVLPLARLEATGYLSSFPQLAGTVSAFDGDEGAAARLAELALRHEDWSGLLSATDLALVPAACQPVYPTLPARGPVPVGGWTLELSPAMAFRREPSEDPARMQMFHVHEMVRVGAPDVVQAWRQLWLERGRQLLADLALDVTVQGASDPFFGRTGRLLAANQRQQELKFELVVPVTAPVPTALASFNYHEEHFAHTYGLRDVDDEPVHTACLGFGLERIVVALLQRHGFAPEAWPAAVRELLWP